MFDDELDECLINTYMTGVEESIRALFDDPHSAEADSAWAITLPHVQGPSIHGLRAVFMSGYDAG